MVWYWVVCILCRVKEDMMYKDFWIGKLGISLYWYDEVCDVKWMYVYDGGVERD